MISRLTPALALVTLVYASGCVVKTGDAADDPHHHHREHHDSSPPPPPPKREKPAEHKEEPKPVTPPATPPPAEEKWTKLGESTANGKNDHDVVSVTDTTKFRAIKLVIKNSDVVLKDVVVHFADGSKFSPETKTDVKEGQMSRTIDLPGDRRTIKSVNFKYSDGKGSGRATIEVWGI